MSAYRVPDGIGEPVIGHRLWLVYTSDWPSVAIGSLLPLNWPDIGTAWTPGARMEASCAVKGGHRSPAVHCRCGLYALRRRPDVEAMVAECCSRWRSHWGMTADAQDRIWIAYGLIDLWGKIIEGTKGFRAEFGYPRTLWLLPPVYLISGCKASPNRRASEALQGAISRLYRREVGSASWGLR